MTATNELFRRRGYNGTALKDVTVAADATTGSLYHFFPGGKAELARAVLLESGRAYQELFEAIAADATGPADAIRDFFDGAAEILAATDYIDICPIGTVAREVASTNDRLRSAVDQVFVSWIDSLSQLVAADSGDDAETRPLATTVVAALEGGFLLARARRDATVLRDIGQQMHDLVAEHHRQRHSARPPTFTGITTQR